MTKKSKAAAIRGINELIKMGVEKYEQELAKKQLEKEPAAEKDEELPVAEDDGVPEPEQEPAEDIDAQAVEMDQLALEDYEVSQQENRLGSPKERAEAERAMTYDPVAEYFDQLAAANEKNVADYHRSLKTGSESSDEDVLDQKDSRSMRFFRSEDYIAMDYRAAVTAQKMSRNHKR